MNCRRIIMKKFGIMVIALAMLVSMTGLVMADPGVNQTFETQGIVLVTSIDAYGNMYSTTDVVWKQSSAVPLTSIPPAPAAGTYYVAEYSEDTQSNGVGDVQYDKDTRLETKAGVNGQYNIEATKQILFNGYNGAEINSEDNLFLDGTGNYSQTKNAAICVFAASTSEYIPAFCNRVEMGSTITGELINARTDSDILFVTDSADTPVVMDHDVRVDTITVGTTSYPSMGKVSAFAEGLIMEGRGNSTSYFEVIEWSEESMVDGDIYLFDKDMHYESGIRRVRET
jgi:hypothetical protein